MNIIDLHCDTLACEVLRTKGENSFQRSSGQLDIPRLKMGGSLLQCFAVYVPFGEKDVATFNIPADTSPWEFFNLAYEYYLEQLAANKADLAPVFQYDDIEKNIADGKISSMLTIEDGMLIDSKPERVRELYNKGVRLITLTWNHVNCLGYPNAVAPDKGLTAFGRETVEQMNALGIIADVSHLSDAGFYDVAATSKKPFVASHSNARAVSNVMRNLTDDMLKALGDAGGVSGLNFDDGFLGSVGGVSKCEDIVKNAKHIASKAGIEAVAFGSDFDGVGCEMEFKDCSGFPMIVKALEKAFTPREIELITHKNALRVIKENIG